jgi:hypothetical protein
MVKLNNNKRLGIERRNIATGFELTKNISEECWLRI